MFGLKIYVFTGLVTQWYYDGSKTLGHKHIKASYYTSNC